LDDWDSLMHQVQVQVQVLADMGNAFNNLRLVLGLGLVRDSSRVRVRIRVKVRVRVMVRVSIRTSWLVKFAQFCCYRSVICTCPLTLIVTLTLIPT